MHLSWAQVTVAEQQPSGGYYYLVLPPQRAESSEHGFRQKYFYGQLLAQLQAVISHRVGFAGCSMLLYLNRILD